MTEHYGLILNGNAQPKLIVGEGKQSSDELEAIEVAKSEFGDALAIINETPNPYDDDVRPRLIVLTSVFRGIEGIREYAQTMQARRDMLAT